MIGCDVSDYLSSRATNWLYLGRNGMHGEVALCDGPTAMMVFMNRRYGEVTEDEDAESEGCPRYWVLQHANPSIAQGSRPVGFAHEYVLRSTCRFSPELPAAALCDCRSQPVREVPGTHQVCPSLST